jgi:hypothetical protein
MENVLIVQSVKPQDKTHHKQADPLIESYY